jgi:hypothetical protein
MAELSECQRIISSATLVIKQHAENQDQETQSCTKQRQALRSGYLQLRDLLDVFVATVQIAPDFPQRSFRQAGVAGTKVVAENLQPPKHMNTNCGTKKQTGNL